MKNRLFISILLLFIACNAQAQSKEFFSESFGEPTDLSVASNIRLTSYKNFDMKAPVRYLSVGAKLEIRYLINNAKLTSYGNNLVFAKHSGENSDNRTFVIEGIETQGYEELTLTYDYACGNVSMKIDELKLKCDGVEITLPDQKVRGRDSFETVTVTIPNGVSKIEFTQDKETLAHMRVDNIKISGKLKGNN